MNQKETVQFFTAIAALYPRDTAFASTQIEMVKVWQRMLEDIPQDLAMTALQKHAASSPFPPSVAEIRKAVTDITCPMMDGDEAYKLACDSRRKYGYYQQKEGMAALPEAVQDAIESYCGTFGAWCDSDEPQGVERSQFLKVWEAHKVRAQQKVALPPSVRETIQKLAGGMCALPEGTES